MSSIGQLQPGRKAPKALRGFSHINRYWDKMHNTYAAKILPGEYYVTTNDELIVTVLGSCVSACIRDPIFGIGGMNHFMLPAQKSTSSKQWGSNAVSAATRYGNYAMEHMINDILKNGGDRRNLELKLFGGGKILKNMTDVGRRNIDFILDYIHVESLNVIAKDLGDIYPRKVVFHPTSGKVKVKKIRSLHNETIAQRENEYMSKLDVEPVESEIDLF